MQSPQALTFSPDVDAQEAQKAESECPMRLLGGNGVGPSLLNGKFLNMGLIDNTNVYGGLYGG